MSAIQELKPYFDAYPETFKHARNSKGYTLQELADLSGVPYNNICTLSSGKLSMPSLYYSAAIAKVLEISLDKSMGLATEEAKQTDVIHALEMENAKNIGKLESIQRENNLLTKIAKQRRVLVFSLVVVCTLLLIAVIAYMIMDTQVNTAGLFQNSGVNILAFFLALVIIAAVVAVVLSAHNIIHDYKDNRPR